MKCKRCGRPLTTEESQRKGVGHTCEEKYRGTPDHPELFETVERQDRPKREPQIFDFDKLTGRTK